jgi:hypothetical protein
MRQIRRLPPIEDRMSGDDQRRWDMLATELRRELALHAATMEMHFWPLIESNIQNRAKERKKSAEDRLLHLDWMGDRDTHLNGLMADALKCIDLLLRDERRALAQLGLSEARTRQLAEQLRADRRCAPTRPHPDMPSGRLAAVTLGRMTAVIDRVRDRLMPRPTGA